MDRHSRSPRTIESDQPAFGAIKAVRLQPSCDGGSPAADLKKRRVHPQLIRVLCVDDHAVLVEGLKARFAIDGGLEVVGRIGTATRLADEVDRLRPDVALLDVEMPGPDVFEMTARMRTRHPEVRVVVLSAHIRDGIITSAMRAGACAYFAKSDELNDIIRGLYEVTCGRSSSFFLSPKVRERCRLSPHPGGLAVEAIQGERPGTMTLIGSLTPREIAILRLIGKGLSRSDIGRQLCRSVKTVDAHQARMMKKLHIIARTDLIRLAIREGLAEA